MFNDVKNINILRSKSKNGTARLVHNVNCTESEAVEFCSLVNGHGGYWYRWEVVSDKPLFKRCSLFRGIR